MGWRIGFLACALCACGSPSKPADGAGPSASESEVREPMPEDFALEFAQDGSYGGSYLYTIDARGNAVETDEWGQKKRRHAYRLPLKSVRRLWRVVNDNHFLLLPEHAFEDANTPTGDCTTISVTAKRRKHEVTMCRQDDAAFNAVRDAFHHEKKRAKLVR